MGEDPLTTSEEGRAEHHAAAKAVVVSEG